MSNSDRERQLLVEALADRYPNLTEAELASTAAKLHAKITDAIREGNQVAILQWLADNKISLSYSLIEETGQTCGARI